MLQSVATLISLLIAAGTLTMIVAVLADDWVLVTRALFLRQTSQFAALPVRARSTPGDRRAHIVSVRSQSVPLRAVA